jgi:hypothetical protein
VRAIRAARHTTTDDDLAAMYGIRPSHVRAIWRRAAWTHVA